MKDKEARNFNSTLKYEYSYVQQNKNDHGNLKISREDFMLVRHVK